ncbi:MAG: CHRD domain-containing protein [Saprospiraceae bacterium]
MKRFNFYLLRFLVFVVLLTITPRLHSQSGKMIFTAHLTGAEENPPVSGNGEGLITVLFNEDQTKMYVQGVVSKLSGPVTAAHFHTGNFGANGGVVLSLANIRNGNRFAGELAVPAGFFINAVNYGLYANVHTAANPGGEIRGQLELDIDFDFVAILSGTDEVPPVNTPGIGLGNLSLIKGYDKILYNMKVNGLSGPITAAHIHKANEGISGPVVQALSFNGNTLSGELLISSLPADFFTTLFSEGYYVNVHTAANPAGEIRGQLYYGGDLSCSANLTGSQETPPVTTTGSGFGFASFTEKLDTIFYAVIVNSLSSTPTAAHIHKAPAGTAGGVVFPLVSVIPGVAYSGSTPLTPATLSDLINGNLYFNVHTAANPGGEIRGQIQTNLRKGFAFDLCGGQEVPKTTSAGYGAGMVSVDNGNHTGLYNLMIDGLSGPATAAHIHTAALGVNGGVKFPLNTPNVFSEGSFALTSADVTLMGTGGTYMNVHTAANPGGEIRGQVGTKILCANVSSVFNEIFTDYKIFPNPAKEGVTLRFTNKDAFTGQMRITDVTGRTVSRQIPSVIDAGVHELYMPMNDLAPGVYYLYLENNGRIVLTQPVVRM